jgi:hypothetical protein
MDIDAIKGKLRALHAKASDKAATDNEVAGAIAAAMKLSVKYGVSMADIESGDVGATLSGDIVSNSGKGWLHEVDSILGNSLANFCDVKIWRERGGDGGAAVQFCGVESDIELALFLRERLKVTMEYEFTLFKNYELDGPVVKGVRQTFMRAFALAIQTRFKEVKAETAHYSRDTTALIIRKGGLIETKLSEAGYNLGASGNRTRTTGHNAQARVSGTLSGNAADIGRSTGSTTIAIGKA